MSHYNDNTVTEANKLFDNIDVTMKTVVFLI